MTARTSLAAVRAKLLPKGRRPPAPPSRDPWLLILRENVAYLANDARRDAAFALLKTSVGTKPAELLAASDAKLLAVTRHGIVPEIFAAKLRDCAKLALELFPPRGDFAPLRTLPAAKAAKLLAKFHGIGKPGAERLLLFAGLGGGLALESNGLRVLVRLGFAKEQKSWSATWRAVNEAIAPELAAGVDGGRATKPADLAALHLALRRHGQELCKNTKPRCGECVFREVCPSAES